MTDVQRRLIHVQATPDTSAEDLVQIARDVHDLIQNGEDPKVFASSHKIQIFSLALGDDQQVNPIQVIASVNPALIAKVARDTNVAYTRGLGDMTVVPWDEETEENKMALVQAVLGRLRFRHDPKAQHEQWVASKLADGWTYGAEKNVEAKTHPALVDYDDLPAEQKMKDYLFAAVVDSLASKLPVPSPLLRPIERAGQGQAEDGSKTIVFEAAEFRELVVGNVFRFVAAPGEEASTTVWVAVSEPYVQYSDNLASWTVDSTSYELGDLIAQLNHAVTSEAPPAAGEVPPAEDEQAPQEQNPVQDYTGDDA